MPRKLGACLTRAKEEKTYRDISFTGEGPRIVEGGKQPCYRMIAVAGVDLRVLGKHLRRAELDQLAEKIGAEPVLMTDTEKEYKEEEVEVNE